MKDTKEALQKFILGMMLRIMHHFLSVAKNCSILSTWEEKKVERDKEITEMKELIETLTQ